jgi:hypothetical protein
MQTTHEATTNGAARDRAGSAPRFTALDITRMVKQFDNVGVLKASGVHA